MRKQQKKTSSRHREVSVPRGTERNGGVSDNGWTKRDTTNFPPYWTPDDGLTFQGVPLEVDDEGEFSRTLVRATMPVACWQGNVDDRESVEVSPGQEFTVSSYARLPLHKYIGQEVRVKCTGKEEFRGRPIWAFEVYTRAPERAGAPRRSENTEPAF